MHPDDNSWDEERLAALLASTGGDGPPPDEAFLDRLREQSAAAFAAESPTAPQPLGRRSPMFVFAWRALAATAAAAALVAGWFATNFAQRDTEVVFGRVLDGLADAKTLHVKLTQAGKAGEAWIAQAGLFRWNLPDGTYQIARGNRVWLVDEKANRAASQPVGHLPRRETAARRAGPAGAARAEGPRGAAQEPAETRGPRRRGLRPVPHRLYVPRGQDPHRSHGRSGHATAPLAGDERRSRRQSHPAGHAHRAGRRSAGATRSCSSSATR